MTATTSSAAIVEAVRSVVGTSGKISLHEPEFDGSEWQYVKECLDSGWVSSVGKYVDRFEAELAAITGARHAVAIVNGTAALHLCLRLSGVSKGDEVLLPALTFIATANVAPPEMPVRIPSRCASFFAQAIPSAPVTGISSS